MVLMGNKIINLKERFNTMKILVVDDEPKIRELIGQYLTVAGYETEFAKDGIEAPLS